MLKRVSIVLHRHCAVVHIFEVPHRTVATDFYRTTSVIYVSRGSVSLKAVYDVTTGQ